MNNDTTTWPTPTGKCAATFARQVMEQVATLDHNAQFDALQRAERWAAERQYAAVYSSREYLTWARIYTQLDGVTSWLIYSH